MAQQKFDMEGFVSMNCTRDTFGRVSCHPPHKEHIDIDDLIGGKKFDLHLPYRWQMEATRILWCFEVLIKREKLRRTQHRSTWAFISSKIKETEESSVEKQTQMNFTINFIKSIHFITKDWKKKWNGHWSHFLMSVVAIGTPTACIFLIDRDIFWTLWRKQNVQRRRIICII